MRTAGCRCQQLLHARHAALDRWLRLASSAGEQSPTLTSPRHPWSKGGAAVWQKLNCDDEGRWTASRTSLRLRFVQNASIGGSPGQ